MQYERTRHSSVDLRLRPLRLDDEKEFVAAHEAMQAEDFPFGLWYEPGMPWATYVKQLAAWRVGRDLPDQIVANTLLVADVDGVIVGRASIRHNISTEFLAREGGHIGYCVLPAHRRRGYATEILRQSLVVVRSLGVDRVLITCDDDNVGSASVIERGGGVFESLTGNRDADVPKRRYWID
jgi:predicted acetyltransferase